MTPKEFAVALLQRLGAPVTTNNVAALVAFAAQEGGHYYNSARFNPLNTTRTMVGSQSKNSAGVKAYRDWDQGVEATAQTLEQTARGFDMSPILRSLMADSPAEDTLRAVTMTPWCPQSAPSCASYSKYPASHYDNYANIPDPIGGESQYGYASITTSSSSGKGVVGAMKAHPWLTLSVAGIVIGAAAAVAYHVRKPGGRPRFLSNPARLPARRSSRVQSLLLPRARYTPSSAIAWARSHGYKTSKVDVTDRYVRLRQADPSRFSRLRTVRFGTSGVKAVVGW